MEAQRERARAANVKDAEAAWSTYGGVHADILKEVGATEFVGYDAHDAQATGVRALIKEGAARRRASLRAIDRRSGARTLTPFYAEMGGEVGDTGVIEGEGFKAEVVDTKAPEKGLACHNGEGASKATLSRGRRRYVQFRGRGFAAQRISRNHTCHAYRCMQRCARFWATM